MKIIKDSIAEILLITALMFALVTPAQAQTPPRTYPFTFSNTSATNLAVIVIPPDLNPMQEGVARINYLNATSDVATATLRIYRTGAPKTIASASSGTTNTVIFSGTTGNDFATSNQVCLLRRKAQTSTGADAWERMVSFTNTSSSVTFTTASGGAVNVNDEVYICTLYAPLLIGANAAKEWAYSYAFYNGESGRAVMLEATSTTLAKIPLVSGWWETPQRK